MIEYFFAEDIDCRVKEILRKLEIAHIDETRLICLRSKGSASRRVIARCHGLSRIMQLALDKNPHYVIEVLSERFDRLSKEEQTKVLIHEILHIPHSFVEASGRTDPLSHGQKFKPVRQIHEVRRRGRSRCVAKTPSQDLNRSSDYFFVFVAFGFAEPQPFLQGLLPRSS